MLVHVPECSTSPPLPPPLPPDEKMNLLLISRLFDSEVSLVRCFVRLCVQLRRAENLNLDAVGNCHNQSIQHFQFELFTNIFS